MCRPKLLGLHFSHSISLVSLGMNCLRFLAPVCDVPESFYGQYSQIFKFSQDNFKYGIQRTIMS